MAIVCGLDAEAKIANVAGDVAVIAGGGQANLIRQALDELRPRAVLSFGVAGGLAPSTAPGDVYVAEKIVGPDGHDYPCHPAWTGRLAEALETRAVTFAGSDVAVAKVTEKRRIHAGSGAALVDMESHVIAAWAVANGADIAAIRVVTDPAHRALPHAATVGMRADGRVDLPAILWSLARNPLQLPDLIRTGLDARAAFAALFRCRERLGPGFARLDF